MEDKLEVDICA